MGLKLIKMLKIKMGIQTYFHGHNQHRTDLLEALGVLLLQMQGLQRRPIWFRVGLGLKGLGKGSGERERDEVSCAWDGAGELVF